jgi:5-oxoprolinase (ATP-hydrolysing)
MSGERTVPATSPPASDLLPPLPQRTRFFSQGMWHEAVLTRSDTLRPGDRIAGPALIIEPQQTVVVEPDWSAEMVPGRALVLTRSALASARRSDASRADPVLLEVFANLFMAIAEEMGVTLQNTASSVNIKERLDFSCAIFDAEGGLVANAPHMPVHLGSMGDCVTAIIAKYGDDISPGWDASAGHHRGGARLPRRQAQVLHRGARASCGYRRHHARFHAALQP